MLFIYTVSLRAVGEKLFKEGRGKREEGRGKREEGRGKREEDEAAPWCRRR
jgi:hypothetical protein